MKPAASLSGRTTTAILDDIGAVLSREGIPLWGSGPSDLMEDERAGFRPSDVVSGARSLICFGLPVPRAVFEQRDHVVETNWRIQNLYYRKLDELSVRIATRFEEEGEKAVPIFGCMPLGIGPRGPMSLTGFLNQIRMGEATRIGTRGRNGLLFHPKYGGRLMLGGVVTTADLPLRAEPQPVEACCPADCRRCIDACPIKAIHPEQRTVSDRCVLFTSRTPLLPKLRFLALAYFRRKEADRLRSITAVDEHTLHICSRCVCACPAA